MVLWDRSIQFKIYSLYFNYKKQYYRIILIYIEEACFIFSCIFDFTRVWGRVFTGPQVGGTCTQMRHIWKEEKAVFNMRGCSHTMTAKNGGVQTTTLVSQNQKLANHVSPLVKKSKVGSPPLHRGCPFFLLATFF